MGVKHQARGSRAVETVAHNRAVQALGVRAVDAQLVGAACEGLERYAGHAATAFQHAVTRRGGFALLVIHPLAGSIVHIIAIEVRALYMKCGRI